MILDDPYGGPLHGVRGESEKSPGSYAGLSIAVSREAGARGGSIARRVANRLGWQVFTQEHLEYLCATESALETELKDTLPSMKAWIDFQLSKLHTERGIDRANAGEMPRLILTLAAKGQAIFVGRGAGFFLPRNQCLHVRIIAPLEARISHMADYSRLTRDEAAKSVRVRDERRSEFLRKHFGHKPTDLYEFDLILNSGPLSEETCADVILAAFNGKRDILEPESRVE